MSDPLTGRAAAEWRADRDADGRLGRSSPQRPMQTDFDQFGHFELGGTLDANRWPQPDLRLVEDGVALPPPLDADALPTGWSDWIAKEAACRGCPQDYLAAALIGAASAWIGNSRHVAVNEAWCEPPHLWFALIGAPSTGKTPALKPIIEACRTIEREAEPGWQADMAEHTRLAEAARALEEQWHIDVRVATKSGHPAPSRPPGAEGPPEPPRPRLVAMDATTEELQRLLAGQPRGLLFVRDELTGWFGNHDRYGGNGGDRAFSSKLGMEALTPLTE